MKKIYEALLRKNGIAIGKKLSENERIDQLERIIEQQDEALMQLAELFALMEEQNNG